MMSAMLTNAAFLAAALASLLGGVGSTAAISAPRPAPNRPSMR